MKRPVFLFAAIAWATGCAGPGPTLLWYGHTPDRGARVEVRRDRDAEWFSTGGRKSARYRTIALESITFSARGRWAFAALRGADPARERWHVVSDAGESIEWDGVADVQFSPSAEKLVYAAERSGLWTVVVDGRAGPELGAVVDGSITFSPDGRRVGYVGTRGGCRMLVVDGVSGACQAAILEVRLANSPSLDAVLARRADGDGAVVMVGGTERGAFESAAQLVTDPSGRHWAVTVSSRRADTGVRVATDGGIGPSFDAVRDLVWAPDGYALAYTARSAAAWFVVRDELVSQAYLRVEKPVFSADGKRMAFIARTLTESEVVLDSKVVWHAPAEATGLRFDPLGSRLAWTYRSKRGAILAVDDRRFEFDVIVEDTVRFSKDGRHWAALVGTRAGRKLFITVDGERTLPFDAAELFGGGLGGGREPLVRLGDWVEAELGLYLSAGSHA